MRTPRTMFYLTSARAASLVACPWENWIQAVCTGISLPTRYGAEIPGQHLSRLGNICVRRQHRNWSYLPPAVQHSATERSLSLLLAPGMLYRIQCHLLRYSLLSDDFQRHIFSNAVFSPSFYLFLTSVQCPWSGFHCDSVTLILSDDDDDDPTPISTPSTLKYSVYWTSRCHCKPTTTVAASMTFIFTPTKPHNKKVRRRLRQLHCRELLAVFKPRLKTLWRFTNVIIINNIKGTLHSKRALDFF